MQNYKELQNLIKIYEETKIWQYVDGDDFFKLEDFDENIYISILGKAGLDEGIVIYDGNQDLLSQLDISYGQYANSPDAFIRFNGYKIALGNPGNLLMPEDKKLLKQNKIKAINVVFRLNQGELPRIISEQESIFLIKILKKIIAIATYIISNKLKFEDAGPDYMFSFKESNGDINSKKIKFPVLKYEFIKQDKLNQELINQIPWIKNEKELNIGLFYTPMFIGPAKKYPLMVIIHDEESDLLVDIIIIQDKEDQIANSILKTFADKKIRPTRISFNSNEIAYICEDIVNEFEIIFRVEENFEKLFDIWLNMYKNI